MLRAELMVYTGLSLLAVAALYLLTRSGNAAAAGQAIGTSIARASEGVVVGVVEGAGSIFGIPLTDKTKAAQARAAGDIYEASKYMPAGEFLQWSLDGFPTGGASGSW